MNINNANSPTPILDDGSDADTVPEEEEEPSYYQPISANDLDHRGSNSDDEHPPNPAAHLCNGHLSAAQDGAGEGDEEEEEAAEAAETAMWRAFREDEERRNAPLTRENAARVMEAMRGVSFSGSPPDWAGRVPEHLWMARLASSYSSAAAAAAASTTTSTSTSGASAVPN